MKAVKKFVLATAVTLIPNIVYAVNFPNPARDYFVDLGPNNTFSGLLSRIIVIVLGIVGLLAIAFIIYGGFQYIVSRGDEELASTGKRTVTNAIIGLILVILSWAIVSVVNNLF